MAEKTVARRTGRSLIPLIALLLPSLPAQAASDLNGFTVRLQQTVDSGPPVAFDIDGDGRMELLVLTRDAFHVI